MPSIRAECSHMPTGPLAELLEQGQVEQVRQLRHVLGGGREARLRVTGPARTEPRAGTLDVHPHVGVRRAEDPVVRGKSPRQAEFGDRLVGAWICFAATGDPNGGP
ncbi:hypothetical protein [Nonomuraea wenchangensis]|uniref:hypothetical protein n=1 Tax=Nonomuraea wenchangensis TaxID=568860 RepID=UPI00331BEB2C